MPSLPFLDPAIPSSAGLPFLEAADVQFESKLNKGQPNGYTPLDGDAKVPLANLPDQASLDAEVTAAIATHNALTNAHGISNTADIVYTNDARLSNARAPTAHSHAIADVTNLQASLDAKQASGNYVLTNDARLSDARTPLAHSHNISDVTNLQTTLDGKASTSHSHAISDVTNLQSALDGKQASGNYQTTSQKNVANGYAGLGADGKIALSQLPAANALESEAIAFAIALG